MKCNKKKKKKKALFPFSWLHSPWALWQLDKIVTEIKRCRAKSQQPLSFMWGMLRSCKGRVAEVHIARLVFPSYPTMGHSFLVSHRTEQDLQQCLVVGEQAASPGVEVVPSASSPGTRTTLWQSVVLRLWELNECIFYFAFQKVMKDLFRNFMFTLKIQSLRASFFCLNYGI